MKNNFEKNFLFACPIYKIRIDPNSYDKEKILNDIKYNKSLKNTRNDAHQLIGNSISDIHHSYRDFDNEDFRSINYEKLIVVYREIFEEFFNKEIYTTKKFTYSFEIVNYSAITEGQWLPSHDHCVPNVDFATIHYLNFKDDHNPTCFSNPVPWAPFLRFVLPEMPNILDNTAPDNSYLWEQFTFPVKEDDMIIFTSALNHEISPQGPTKELRITISTNINIKNYEKSNN